MTASRSIELPRNHGHRTHTYNFVSNEVIVSDLIAEQVWPLLINTDAWPSSYDGISDITFPAGDGPELRLGTRLQTADRRSG